MATLAHILSKRQVRISSQCLVGQSPDSCVHLSNGAISAHHARIAWHDNYWVVRDLGSDRGTYLNGARLDSGNDARLSRGDTLRFGAASEEFSLIDAAAPRLSARRLSDHVLVEADGSDSGELCLPSRVHPEVKVFEEDGGWVMSHHGRHQPVQNAELIVAGGEIYRLSLPCSPASSVAKPSIVNVEIEFRVSPDEEHVEIWLHRPDGQTDILPARAHYYTLLVLARARLTDRDEDLPSEARGWRSSPELSRMLAVDESSINVHVHRIRKELEAIGFEDAAKIISRQRARRLIRINSGRVLVTKV